MMSLLAVATAGLLAGCYSLPTREAAAWIDYAPPEPIAPGTPRGERNLRVFDCAWETVKTYYYDEAFHGVDWDAARARHRPAAEAARDDDALYAAIGSLLGELKDGHTRAQSPQVVEERRERRWVGLGLETAALKDSGGQVLVTNVSSWSPASHAGVRPGWILRTCNGQEAHGFLSARRFSDGEAVACVFLDQRSRTRTLDLVARVVHVPPVRERRLLNRGCIYLRFDEFKYADAAWLYRQLLVYGDVPSLIIDLRYNSGGDIFCLEAMAGLFIPGGKVLGTAAKSGMPPRSIASHRPRFTPYYEGRVAFIVSSATSSAAEIFANAMREYCRSPIVGQRTVGHVLNAYQGVLPDGGEITFSIRDFLTPDGRHLEGAGVEPDVKVVYRIEDLRAGRDIGVAAALAALRVLSAAPGS